MFKTITTAAAAIAAALTLTACNADADATAGPEPTPTVTVTATPTPTAPAGTLIQQFRAEGLHTIGLTNDTLEIVGQSMCDARDVGVGHGVIVSTATSHLAEFYDADEVETIVGIWYANLCPEFSA